MIGPNRERQAQVGLGKFVMLKLEVRLTSVSQGEVVVWVRPCNLVEIVESLRKILNLAIRFGDFSVGGLSPGPHALRVEPIDDADVESFFEAARTVDVDFRVAFVDRVVIVPRGGDSGEVTVKVVRK